MAEPKSQLRAIAETAYAALNANDLDAFLEVIADDVEFTSLVAEAEGTTYRSHPGAREWWTTVRAAIAAGRDPDDPPHISRSVVAP